MQHREEVFTVKDVKGEMREADRQLQLRVVHLLREGLLRLERATSVMNDSGDAYDIAKKLVAMAETVLVVDEKPQRMGR